MSEVKIAGVMRAGAYSPNHIGNDAAIFNATAEQLRKRGFVVNVYSEEKFKSCEITEDVILNMCRDSESISKLQQLEDSGKLVINSGYGIENCTRERMARILLGSGIPYPESIIVNTDESVKEMLERTGMNNCWVKCGGHSQHKEDVSYARNRNEAQEVLQEYFYRGIKRAVINRHLAGDLIKFYGVRGTPFFYWFYPFETGHVMQGYGAEVTPVKGIKLDEELLKSYCREACEELNVVVYGGDCIVSPEGKITIIDFNDWPSFAPCSNEAAPYIAKSVLASVKEFMSKR
ncbi:MAG: hypothetical protein IJ328_01450 [Muribaculaceae bacterium]|nr:hypothetical protein [Muribaculaceae bacterium]